MKGDKGLWEIVPEVGSECGGCVQAGRLLHGARKLAPKFLGPFTVIEVLSPVAYRLKLPSTLRIHPVFHSSLLKRYLPNTLLNRSQPPPPPVEVGGIPEWEVEDIRDARRIGRGWRYLIKWKDFPEYENSWIRAADLHAPEILAQFHARTNIVPKKV